MQAMQAIFQRIPLSTLRARLMLVVVLALLPLLLFTGYSALLTPPGGLPGHGVPGVWFLGLFAFAGLGALLAVWAGSQLLASTGRADLPARHDGAALSTAVERSALGLLMHETGESSTELALRATHARLVTAQRIGKIGNWEFDIAANVVWWSDQTYEIYGLTRESSEATGVLAASYEGVLAQVHAPDRERFEEAQKAFFAGDASLDIEHRIVKASGEIRWVHGLGEATVDAQGKPVMLSGTVQDITERKLAEEALRASEAQFRLLTDTMPQIVCTMRADGWLTYFNKGWLDYTALGMEDSLGRGWTQLIHPEDVRQVVRLWTGGEAGHPTGSETSEIEFRLRRADGIYRWMLGRAHPLLEEAGQKPKWLGTFTDIQDLKQATELLEKNLAMNRIAGRVAHLGG
ncbi:MAG: PAS domain-containing protein, partial [Polaromonas sp.]